MSAPVFLKGNYSDFYGSSMLPALEEVFRSELTRHVSLREKLGVVKQTKNGIYQTSEIHDMPLFSQMSEAEDYSYQRPNQGASSTISVKKWGSGVSFSQESIDDGKIDFVADAVRKMAKSALETQEINFMALFNGAFGATNTPDGEDLCDTGHILPSGRTFSNRLSTDADLSPSSLESMLTSFETNFIGDTGIIYRMTPKVLLVTPANKRYAQELIGSELKADSMDNNLNSLKGEGLSVASSALLTDADAWFLLASKEDTGLRIISREGIVTKSHEDFNNDSIRYKSKFREEVGAVHAYGVFGTSGG